MTALNNNQNTIDINDIEALEAFYMERGARGRTKPIHEQWRSSEEVEVFVEDYESPNCPEGYDTILHWLANNEPVTFALLEQFADATEDDDNALTFDCLMRGIKPVEVLAGAWLVREGVLHVNAYPVAELIRYFSEPEVYSFRWKTMRKKLVGSLSLH